MEQYFPRPSLGLNSVPHTAHGQGGHTIWLSMWHLREQDFCVLLVGLNSVPH